MDLHIKTKFDIGQDVCLVYRNKQQIDNFIPCTFCDGNGFFIYKGEKCKCPKCSGRRIRTKKRMVIKYNVHYIEWKVSTIRIAINENNDPIITYKLIGRDYYNERIIKETADEKHLFATYEDAKKYCDEKNNIEIGGTNNA